MRRIEWIASLSPIARNKFLSSLCPDERKQFRFHWRLWARPQQLAPGHDWQCWLICAGRGFGKTRAGSEWVREIARNNRQARIALVGASIAEVRAVMVEGESGILACSPPDARPIFESSLKKISWANGAQALLYSACDPESLRGPQHSHAWCDEIAKWDNSSNRAIDAWDNLQMGLRLGENPRITATTTPRAVPLLRRLIDAEASGDIIVSRGSTYDNSANLPEKFIAAMTSQFGGSTLGAQEIDGHLLEEVEGALWSRSLLEQSRQQICTEPMARIIIGVDPPISARGDECGIVVAGVTKAGLATVLADASVAKASPEQWAQAVAATAMQWNADRVVAEANQGGQMVESVLRAADCQMPIKLVHASVGKSARAEPIAALYEAGRVKHIGLFPQMEDQLCGLMAGGSYEGPGRSPDRADALVWALSELMLGKRVNPRLQRV